MSFPANQVYRIKSPIITDAQKNEIKLFMQLVNFHFNKNLQQQLEITGELHGLSLRNFQYFTYVKKDYKKINVDFTLMNNGQHEEYVYFTRKIILDTNKKVAATIKIDNNLLFTESIDDNVLPFGAIGLSQPLNIQNEQKNDPIIIFTNKLELHINQKTKKLLLHLCDLEGRETGLASIMYFRNNA